MGIILLGQFSSESATVRRYGHFCVAVGAVGLLSELSERRMTVTEHGHCRESLSDCRDYCRTTVGLLSDCRALSGSVGLLSEVTVGLSDRGSGPAGRCERVSSLLPGPARP